MLEKDSERLPRRWVPTNFGGHLSWRHTHTGICDNRDPQIWPRLGPRRNGGKGGGCEGVTAMKSDPATIAYLRGAGPAGVMLPRLGPPLEDVGRGLGSYGN